MSQRSAQQTRQASKDALKVVYYVIIGIAITGALNRVFLKQGTFLGLEIFERKNLPSTILLFAFLPTICRFVHGASIHLDVISEKRYKPLIDFVGFFLQAAFFYLMATSLKKTLTFSFFFGLMLLFDALWLLFLWKTNYIELGKTEVQWLRSDFAIIAILIMLNILHPSMVSVWSPVTILIVAIIATFLDYFLNKDFYFPIGGTTSANTE